MNRFKKRRNRDKWKRIKNKFSSSTLKGVFYQDNSGQAIYLNPILNRNYRNPESHINYGTLVDGSSLYNFSFSQKDMANKIDKYEIIKEKELIYTAVIDKDSHNHWLPDSELINNFPIIYLSMQQRLLNILLRIIEYKLN